MNNAAFKNKARAEGDGILQLLLWLDRTPESFVRDFMDADDARFHLRELGPEQILRWDTKALYSALNTRRQARGMAWTEVAQELDGFTPGILTHLAKGRRIGFPGVMRIVRWLDQPSATFTRISDW